MTAIAGIAQDGKGREMRSLDDILSSIGDEVLRSMCRRVIDDRGFILGFGSSGHHHGYPGGLFWHTTEVANYAIAMASQFDSVNMDVLITASIFHDYAKRKEYELVDGEVRKTEYRKLVRHVAGSHADFLRLYDTRIGDVRNPDDILHIQHCILAHHGRLEWQSPVEPETLEAYILHFSDMLSAKFGPSAIDVMSGVT